MNSRPISLLTLLGLLCGTAPALAQQDGGNERRGDQEFIGIDLDTGGIYYDGRDSGHYCLYRTIEVFNRLTGVIEPRRVRRCGRGLTLR
ncbi:hypothetical protein EU555_03460 [Methylobacterium nonmethylotrophicum]|uniref:Uncharacterized protein n=2 Tax=Methylobacterium nonmethylotrophicum TaxID=1141884 RepID=A0A4Z0NWZ4_9HYPH|nr:hypothetical protein EU555_03460 [Methylobacterium nonmethylotrophicum]